MKARARILSVLATTLVASAIAAGAAEANIIVRPVKSWANSPAWLVSPSLSTPAAVLDDDVVQPATPDTTDYLTGTGKGTFYTTVGMAAPTLAAGQSVTGATAWIYAATASNQWLTASLWSGYKLLAWRAFPPGQAASWLSVPISGPVTSDQAGNLALLLRTDSSSNSSWGPVSAAYVDLATTGDPSPEAPAPPPASDPAPAVGIRERVVKVTIVRGHPVASFTLSCPSTAAARCRGRLTIRFLPQGSKRQLAVSARCGRGCRPIGSQSFSVAEGRRRKVRVRMALKTDQVFGHRRRVKTRVTADARDASGRRGVSSNVVTLTR